jgi:hypothetical protein
MPYEAYLLCLARFTVRTRAYILLRNGIVDKNGQGESLVKILCDADFVEPFLAMVGDVCPEFTDKIKQYAADA